MREFADLLPLAVGLLNGLVALSGTEALPEAISQPQTHAATMIIRHPAGLRDITEEIAGIGTHRPPGIEEGEAVVGGRDTICRGLLSRSTQANTKERRATIRRRIASGMCFFIRPLIREDACYACPP